MCRPSCCDKNGGQGAGVAAVAIIIGAALIAAKIDPIMAGIVHTVLEVLRVVALTTGLVLGFEVITWAVIVITRWQLQRKTLAGARTQMVTPFTIWMSATRTSHPADCLACGGNGTVLRAIGGGRYQPGQCPV